MMIGEQSSLDINDSVFSQNSAYSQGVFKIYTDTYLTVENTVFSFNYAEKTDSVGEIMSVSEGSYFKNVKFFQNQAYISD